MTVRTIFSGKLPAAPRARFDAAAALGCTPLFTVRQVHGSHVVVLDEHYRYPGVDELIAKQPEGDAIVTGQTGLYIGVKTADCVPVLLWDDAAGVIAAVHAGWRGTAACVVTETLRVMQRRFGAQPERIRAALGPSVCGRCYETGAEVAEAMPPEGAAHIISAGGNKYFVDLPAVNIALLRAEGLRDIAPPAACTACEPNRYWSHRRHGTERGLQLSMIAGIE